MKPSNPFLFFFLLGLAALLLNGCQPQTEVLVTSTASTAPVEPLPQVSATPLPERAKYNPGELVNYIAQPGDTLPALAVHFNTSIDEIREANPIIPANATTLPPGMPMQIPIYYQSFWGTAFQIIPDSVFVNGPAHIEFDTQAFVNQQPGWLRDYVGYVGGSNRSGAGVVDYVATNFSISPRLLLALLEYQTGALSQASMPEYVDERYPLGYEDRNHRGVYLQLVWAANLLNNGYYSWRTGNLTTLHILDGTIEHPDPWQNAATVALQFYFSQFEDALQYRQDIGSEGIARVYWDLFGDPWGEVQVHIPGSLQQPEFILPFGAGETWAYTGGPHTGWGTGEPWAALDFAPPGAKGCGASPVKATAVSAGVVVRSETGIIEIDLDGDGDARTGWAVFYLHIGTSERAPVGTVLETGDPIGYPSCEGGTSTGTHIHIVRKFNGEWIPAEGPLAFNLEGWVAHNGDEPYKGTLTRYSETVIANINANVYSNVTADER
jgi:LasA protease